eukprot:7678-Eustigmatos_ZCMA.PRE.1
MDDAWVHPPPASPPPAAHLTLSSPLQCYGSRPPSNIFLPPCFSLIVACMSGCVHNCRETLSLV